MKKSAFIFLLSLVLMSCNLIEEDNCPPSESIDLTIINQTQDRLVIQALRRTCSWQTNKGIAPSSNTQNLPILAGETIQATLGSTGSLQLTLYDWGILNPYAYYYPNLSDQQLTLYIFFDGTYYKFGP